MITYVTEVNDTESNTEIVGVSSQWNIAVKRLMEHHPEHTSYDEKRQVTSDLWAFRIGDRCVGYITKMELDVPLS